MSVYSERLPTGGDYNGQCGLAYDGTTILEGSKYMAYGRLISRVLP